MRTIFVALSVLLCVLFASNQSAAQIKLRLAYTGSSESAIGQAAERLADQLAETSDYSEYQIQVKVLPGSSLGDPFDLVKLAEDGVVDLLLTWNRFYPPLWDEFRLQSLPANTLSLAFLFSNESVAQDFAANSGLDIISSNESTNLCPLGIALGATQRLVSEAPVRDFKQEIAQQRAFLGLGAGFRKAFGNNNVSSVNLSNRLEALERGYVVALPSQAIQRMQKSISISRPVSYHFVILAANCESLDILPDKSRQDLKLVSMEIMEKLGSSTLKKEQLIEEEIISRGGRVIEYDKDDDDDDCDDDECSSFGPSAGCDQNNIRKIIYKRAAECCSESSACDQ